VRDFAEEKAWIQGHPEAPRTILLNVKTPLHYGHEAEQPSLFSPASDAEHACPIENSVNRNFSPIYRK